MGEALAGEVRDHWVWEDRANGKPWTAGLWDPEWPTQTFTTGESLPPGPIASLGTFHNQPGRDHRFALRLYSTPQGWLPTIWVRFADVRYERPEGREFSVRDEAGIIYHRADDAEPLMVKIESPDGDGAGLYRVYSWWYLVKRPHQLGADGRWRPV